MPHGASPPLSLNRAEAGFEAVAVLIKRLGQQLAQGEVVIHFVSSLATGANFPDGLAGGAAAGSLDIPMLLVRSTDVPSIVGQEIIRLHPTRIVILGGSGAVSDAVMSELSTLLGAP